MHASARKFTHTLNHFILAIGWQKDKSQYERGTLKNRNRQNIVSGTSHKKYRYDLRVGVVTQEKLLRNKKHRTVAEGEDENDGERMTPAVRRKRKYERVRM